MTVIRPQPGPQTMAARSKARLVVYGGAAGGGKSWLQAFMAARHVDTPGYNAILFRRTFPMLEGGGSLLQEKETVYPDLGGTFNRNRLEWKFPSNALIELKHLQQVYEWDQARSQGLLIDVEHPSLGTVQLPGPPLRIFDGTGAEWHREHTAPPLLGQHNDAVLAWLADSAEPIDGTG